MNRSAAYRRHQRHAHINRKKNIIKKQNGYWHYRHDGELDKGKIHCSCSRCRHRFSDVPKFSDRRQAISDIDQLQEFGSAGERGCPNHGQGQAEVPVNPQKGAHTMFGFLIGIFAFLTMIAVYLCMRGVPIWEALSIFIYPVCILSVYIYFQHKLDKELKTDQADHQKRLRDAHASQEIIRMTRSVNDGPAFSAEMFDELDEKLAELGIALHCDFTGYFT